MAVKREDVKAIVSAIGGKENLEAATALCNTITFSA